MKRNWKTSICFLVFLGMARLLASRGQEPIRTQEEPDVDKFPIADYSSAKNSWKRSAKGRKYNRRHAPRVTESIDGIFSVTDWEVGLSAFPVAESSAIVIGEITDAQAQLSEDETNIYSEFIFRVDEVLKSDTKIPFKTGDVITVERLGGRLRLPSGKVVVSRISHQDLPRIGGRYVLFLNHSFLTGPSEDFQLLTGYELRKSQVFPLDKLNPEHPIAAYSGFDQKLFLTELAKVLANPTISQK